MRVRRYVLPGLLLLGLVAATPDLAAAQDQGAMQLFRNRDPDTGGVRLIEAVAPRQSVDGKLPPREKVNAGTVTILTAPVGGAFAAMGSDMVRVLDDGDNLRVLPIIGKGSVQNLVDIMLLRNVDMGFVVSDALEFVKKEYDVTNIDQRVSYIVKLFNNDLHIVARKDIKTIYDLAGKKVMSERNLGYFSVRTIFDRLNIAADVDSRTDDAAGLQKLLNGEADAWIVSAGKVAPIVRSIKNDEGRLHFVSVPYETSLHGLYLPSTLSAAEYPNLVAAGADVDTVAASTLLMVYNWPPGSERYNRVAKFVDALFTKIEQFREPSRHPKWRDTSLAASVAGWQRFKAADDWLAHHGDVSLAASSEARQKFEKLLREDPVAANGNIDKEKLFRQFLQWQRAQPPGR
jgi:TRAP-type uncharacterized transport system substrate-binding protein